MPAVKGAANRVAAYAYSVAASVWPLRMFANPMVKLVFLRQIYFTAVRSLRLISIVAFAIGAAFVWQLSAVLGNDPRLFELVERVLMQNAAPLAAAIIVIGRSATAISSELAYMHSNGEWRHCAICAYLRTTISWNRAWPRSRWRPSAAAFILSLSQSSGVSRRPPSYWTSPWANSSIVSPRTFPSRNLRSEC
jgi:hypothetical protein